MFKCFRLCTQARGEEREEDSEWSSEDISDGDGEAPDLLELLLKHAERVAPRRGGREPRLLCLDLSSELLPVRLRGLLPCHSIPFLNAWVQALLACSPLVHLLAQEPASQKRGDSVGLCRAMIVHDSGDDVTLVVPRCALGRLCAGVSAEPAATASLQLLDAACMGVLRKYLEPEP